MMHFIEANAGRIAAGIQAIGVGFDPEVLSLPGGSFIAAFFWLYACAVLTLKRFGSYKRKAVTPVAASGCLCLGRCC